MSSSRQDSTTPAAEPPAPARPSARPTARASRTSAPNVAIVGATGAVGEEFLRVLHQRGFPLGELRLLASARSAGKTLRFGDRELTCTELTEDSFKDIDLALFFRGRVDQQEVRPRRRRRRGRGR